MAASRKTSLSPVTLKKFGDTLRAEPGRSHGYLLRDCYRSFSKALEDVIRPHGIGVGQWYFLRELWAEDGLSQGDLSLRVGMSAPTAVVAIRRMVEHGLVVRKPDDDDGRKMRIYLTKKGHRFGAKLLPLALEVTNIATKGFTQKEIREFRSMIERMKKNLSEI